MWFPHSIVWLLSGTANKKTISLNMLSCILSSLESKHCHTVVYNRRSPRNLRLIELANHRPAFRRNVIKS